MADPGVRRDWRLLLDVAEPRSGADNMAIDETLLESVQAGGPAVLRLYRWDPPALSFGRNQPAAGAFDAGAIADRGFDIVRRPTGGAAVFHAEELTYAVAAPVSQVGAPRVAYRSINGALLAGLQRLGVAAELAQGSRRPASLAGACFQDAAAGEVAVAGRKLIGSAQRYERKCILQHGSLLLAGSQRLAAERPGGTGAALNGPGEQTLTEVLGRSPDLQTLVPALVAGFEAVLGIRLAPGTLTAHETARAAELANRYRSSAWTWRR